MRSQEDQRPNLLYPLLLALEHTTSQAKAHASRVFLETTNVITFTNVDMEVQHLDHSKPLYIAA